MIYHITTKQQWSRGIDKGAYDCESLILEGFIHTSTMNQIQKVYEKFYSNKQDLIVLCIDTSCLNNDLIFEEASNGELFPHIYGTINLDAVYEVKPIEEFISVLK